MIDRLRDELLMITSDTRVLAEVCRFRRVGDPSTLVATGLSPTPAEEAAALANHERLLLWRDAVSSVLRRRGIACGQLYCLLDDLSPLVLLQRRDIGTITRTRWRKAFNDELERLTIELQRMLTDHADAFVFPRMRPKAQQVFRLQVESGRGSRWRVFATAMELEAEEIVAEPFAESELREFFDRHCQPDAGDPSLAVLGELEAMRAFGRCLHRSLFSGCIGTLYDQARLQAVQSGSELRLEITARGNQSRAIPWETLHDGVRFLSTSSEVLLSRSIGHAVEAAPALLPRPLRVLLTVSSPLGVDVIDARAARRTIEVALAPLVLMGLVELDVPADGSMDGLRRRLRRAEDEGRPYHVWHFVGHGEYDRDTGRDELILWRGGGAEHAVTTSELASVVADHRQLRLVVLNACREGSDVRDRSWGAAAALVEAGVSTVLAMQFEFSYAAAAVFDAELYGSITDGATVDQAVTAARRALIDVPNYAEWVTPVVFHGARREVR